MNGRAVNIGFGARLVALLATCATLLAGCVLLVATPAAAAPGNAVADYGGCLKGQGSGDLLLLIDESGSLTGSDPAAARVAAAKYLLTTLATQTDRAGVKIDIQVAGFATRFDPAPTPWTTLSPATLPELVGAVDKFATRQDGLDTDYWTALDGARRSLADHAGAANPPRCQAIAWFTDGKLDVEPRDGSDPARPTELPYAPGVDARTQQGADAATAAAAESLCRPGGLADSLRSSHVVTFAVGLENKQAAPRDFDLMRAIATGEQFQGKPCGKITEPSPGTFALASDLDGLLRTFDGILGPSDIALPPAAVCAPADRTCRGHEFVLDESITNVHVLGQALGVAGLQAELIGPDGVARPLSNKTLGATQPLTFGPVTGSYTWQTEATVVIDIADDTRAAEGWRGLWALRFVDPRATTSGRTSTTSIHISTDIAPAWENKPATIAAGSRLTDVRLGLARAGQRVEPQSLRGTVEIGARLLPATGAAVPVAQRLGKADLADPVTLDLSSVAPGQATFQLTLGITTAPTTRPRTGEPVPGTRLADQQVDIPLTIGSPAGFPTVADVDFGTADGSTELTGVLAVTGPGCVWVPAGAQPDFRTTPDGIARVTIAADSATSAESCVQVPEGQTGQVTLRMTADAAGNGTADGTLPVQVAPLNSPDRAITVDVAFTSDFRKPVNVVSFLVVLLVALLLGVGIPLALLALARWAGAKIPAHQGLYHRRIPVTVEGDRLVRSGGGPFGIRNEDLTELAGIAASGSRRLELGGVVLRTRSGWRPFGTGHVSVEQPPGFVSATSTTPRPDSEGRSRLPLAVHNTWVLLHNLSGRRQDAEVLVLVSADASPGRRAQLVEEITSAVPGLLADVAPPPVPGGPGLGGRDDRGGEWAPVGGGPTYGPDQGGGWSGGGSTAPYAGGPAVYGPPGGAGDGPRPPTVRLEKPGAEDGRTSPGGWGNTAYQEFYGPGGEPPTDRTRRDQPPPPPDVPYGHRP